MQNVSNEFKQAVYAPIRTTKGRVTFDISDVTAKGDILSITTTAQSDISDKEQLVNSVREQTYNLFTSEPNRVKLDGSFTFADDDLQNNGELGYSSHELCGNDGYYSVYPTITFEFTNTHTSMGITITFDVLNNEYATEFTVNAYDSGNNVILSQDIIDNTDVQAVVIDQFYNYKKIEIIIKKWNKPYRRCRVVEVDFGVVKVYSDNKLMKMDLVEEMDIATSTIPSAEFKFTVDNSNKDFNILNPDGFYKALQERQNVVPEIGIVTDTTTEYVKLGNYYLMDWASDEGSLTATFTARNILDIMSSYDYENLTPKTNYTLYDMAEDIFSICGVTDYEIDSELQNISTNGLVEKTDCRSVLQMIVIAGMCNVFVDRENNIILKQNSTSMGTEEDTIDFDNMYDIPKIELDEIVKSVTVTYYTDLETFSTYAELNPGVSEGKQVKVENNTLINTLSQAQNVADWVLRQLNHRAKYTANWRGNPAHELNDVIVIEDSYSQNKKSIITKIELSYQGYLKGKTETRGLTE